ncbi:STAS domain-containing protein [Azospirillum thiophilum]|nr:STAS domain-containing protein [Azospirillum thiophilum]
MSGLRDAATVECSGSMTLSVIEAVRDRLQDALGSTTHVEVDCRGLTDADVCFIQLLLSARVAAARRGIVLRMSQPLGAPLRDVLERGGFVDKSGAIRPDDDFWIGGP